MVRHKKLTISKKKAASPPPAADEWIKAGGTDPDMEDVPKTSVPTSKPASEKTEPLKTEQSKKGKYPHRVSFDMDNALYKRLKWASFDSSESMNAIARQAVEEWLSARSY